MSESVLAVGAIAAAITAVSVLIKNVIWPFFRRMDAANRLIDEELNHNGGGSMKDHVRDISLKIDHISKWSETHQRWSESRSGELDRVGQRLDEIERDMRSYYGALVSHVDGRAND